MQLVSRTDLDLLVLRTKTNSLAQSEREKVMEMIQQARMLDQELVVAVASSLEKILNSFYTPD